MKWALAASAALVAVWAQTSPDKPDKPAEPPILQNTGKPMLLDFHCTDDDIQQFGLSCTEDEPCPIYLELVAFETVGNQLFAAGNIHTRINTLYSVLLSSSDGRDAVAAGSEVITNGAERPEKTLCLLRRFEPAHGSLTLTRRLV